jgi:UDP-N-acetylglucosamine--N-acetylmuramyl-(pentapeptide) pyrophosphoryl-undecaprenol N-acetylglucosamine transferase
VLEAFPGSFGDKVITRCTGNPVRKDVAELPEPAERFAGRTGPVRILVVGGSLGAQVFNEQLPRALALLPEADRPQVRHQCGEKNLEAAQQSYDAAGVKASVEPFIADMAEAYAWADLVVCRAGALTVSELCAAGVGAILVPFPHAVDDHQTRNGQHMVKAGAAILVPQPRFTPEALADTLKGLSGDREKILGMAQAARSLARPDATERVVNYCLEAANG